MERRAALMIELDAATGATDLDGMLPWGFTLRQAIEALQEKTQHRTDLEESERGWGRPCGLPWCDNRCRIGWHRCNRHLAASAALLAIREQAWFDGQNREKKYEYGSVAWARIQPHAVYRLFAEDGALLYVGCTLNPAKRLIGHKRAPWWGEVHRTELAWFDNRLYALVEETRAIQSEGPRHNRATSSISPTVVLGFSCFRPELLRTVGQQHPRHPDPAFLEALERLQKRQALEQERKDAEAVTTSC